MNGVLPPFPFGGREAYGEIQDLDRYLAMEPIDPEDPTLLAEACDANDDLFLSVKEALAYKQEGKAAFVHVWGVFELSQFLFEKNGLPGIETALINMVAEPEKTLQMYYKLAAWSAACAEQAIQAGADVIELSDDWGQQNTMLFSPKLWWTLIYPTTKLIVDTAQRHDVPVILFCMDE